MVSDLWVLQLVEEGYRIKFFVFPPPRFLPTMRNSSPQNQSALEEAIFTFCEKRVLERVPILEEGCSTYSTSS
ncbi:hypothetical protein XENTR_v10005919 [Xenopus tropicalis]|nr:hypothetical protein XENTR_v10005919 [Xenopus tropicalis]